MHFLLIYDTAPDYLQRRAEFRSAHLALAWQAAERGELPQLERVQHADPRLRRSAADGGQADHGEAAEAPTAAATKAAGTSCRTEPGCPCLRITKGRQ